MTAPTIEPAPAPAPDKSVAGEQYSHPPYVPPYPAPRRPWYARHPGTAATVGVFVAALVIQGVGGVWDMFLDKERAERQRIVDEGVRGETESRKAVEADLRAAITDNGQSIQALAKHQLEASARTHRLLGELLHPKDPSRLAPRPELVEAQAALRTLQKPQ